MDAARALNCPVDGQQLSESQPQRRIRACGACQGILFSEEHLVQVVRNNGIDLRKLTKAPAREIDCPGCSVPMRVFDIEGIEIDICGKCSMVWMDEGEFVKTRAVLDQDAVRRKSLLTERYQGPSDRPIPIPDAYGFNRQDLIWDIISVLFRILR
jgi:Zn-finger nucleic acid-binding protein